jgi:transcriptional regulator with XRE-family HTH domain
MSDRSRRRPYLETFARRLSEIIEERNISQTEAADMVGVNQSMMWFYCNARAEPRFAALTNIAKEFDVSTDWLLGLSDERRLT